MATPHTNLCKSRHFPYPAYKSLSFPPNFSTSPTNPPNSLVPYINYVIFLTPPTNPYHFHPIRLYAILMALFSLPPLSFPPNFSTSPTNSRHFHPIRLYPILITLFSLPRLQISIISTQFLYLPYKSTSFPPNSLIRHINGLIFPTPPTNLYYFHRISSPHTNSIEFFTPLIS